MERFTSQHLEIGNDSKLVEKIEKKYGVDGLKVEKNEFNLNLYPEFVPSFNHWVAMDEQRERLEEIIGDDEALIK